MAWGNGSSDTALQPLVRQLRDALRSAETELQRRCFISSEISEALASADAYLGERGAAQGSTVSSPERARRLIRRV